MRKVIYLDELLLVNFAAGAVFLLGAGLMTGHRCKGGRLLMGAVISGISSLALLLPQQPFVLALLYKVGVCVSGTAAAYGWPGLRAFVQLCAWCVLLSLAMTGMVLLPGAETRNLSVYLPLSPGLLLACAGGVYLVLRGMVALFGRVRPPLFDAQITLYGCTGVVHVFCDTGFFVQEPLSGRTVILVRYTAVQTLLPRAMQEYLEAQLSGKAAVPPPGCGVRMVPCTTLSGRMLLPAVPVQALARYEKGHCRVQHDLLAAFCSAGQPDGPWTALVGEQTAAQLGR
ncbi:MAG: sigma-E processing peptidase SpoIIGA [Faecalibacterium sp.]